MDALAVWGVRWIGELGDQDLDPKLLLWDMRRNITLDAIPDTRTVILFVFPDVQPRNRHWWLVMNAGAADVCDTDPGYEVSVTVTADLRHMVRIWRGDTPGRTPSAPERSTSRAPNPPPPHPPDLVRPLPLRHHPRPTVHDAGGALQAR